MASWQAHVAVWMLKLRLKRQLAHAKVPRMRQLLTPPPFRIPPDVTITPGEVGGVAGEWVQSARGGDITLLYLHGVDTSSAPPRRTAP